MTSTSSARSGDQRSVDAAQKRRSIILEGPIARGILQIALPSVATMLLLTANSFLDRFFVGQFGPEAQAAVTHSITLMFTVSAAAFAVSIGAAAIIGRAIGAGREEEAVETLRQALLCALLLSIAIAVPVLIFRGPILRALHVQPETMSLASNYMLVTMLAVPTLFLLQTFNGAFRGMGDTIRPLRVMIGSVLTHALFNFVLIFGVPALRIPAFGVVGGAIALNFSQIVAVALYLYFLRGTPLAPALKAVWKPHFEEIRRLMKIGLPAGGQQLLRTGSSLLFLGIVIPEVGDSHATAAAAALGIGMTAESLAFMPGLGYQTAASAFVAQNLGAEKPDRARRAGWAAAWQAVMVMTVMGVVFFLAARPFAQMFLGHSAAPSDPQIAARTADAIQFTVSYLQIACFAEPFLALSMVLTGALQGAGETKSPTAVTAISLLGVRLPMGWLLASQFGVTGAWWAMTLSTMVQGALIAGLFARGRWLKVKV